MRVAEFGFHHVLFTAVDHVSRLPRNTMMPEAARLYRENIALKAQLDAHLSPRVLAWLSSIIIKREHPDEVTRAVPRGRT